MRSLVKRSSLKYSVHMSGFQLPSAPKRTAPNGAELGIMAALIQQRQQITLQKKRYVFKIAC